MGIWSEFRKILKQSCLNESGLPPGWSFVRWSFIRVVFYQYGLSSGWSFIRWSFIRVASHQGCAGWLGIKHQVSYLLSHEGGLSSGGLSSVWSPIRVVFHQMVIKTGWSPIKVDLHQSGLPLVWSPIRVVFRQGFHHTHYHQSKKMWNPSKRFPGRTCSKKSWNTADLCVCVWVSVEWCSSLDAPRTCGAEDAPWNRDCAD